MLEQKNMSEEIINRLRKSCKETEAKNKTLHEKVIELENICLKGQINMEEAQRIQEESVSARNDAI